MSQEDPLTQENPYAAPTTDIADIRPDAADSEGLRIASQGKRFLNLIIDTFGYYALSFVAGFVMALTGTETILDGVGGLLFGVVVNLVYFVTQEAVFGRTLGKLVTGTKVVNLDGQSPSFGQVVGRTFARIIPFEAFSFFGGKGYPVGWHDSLSKTRVVTTR